MYICTHTHTHPTCIHRQGYQINKIPKNPSAGKPNKTPIEEIENSFKLVVPIQSEFQGKTLVCIYIYIHIPQGVFQIAHC